MLIWGGITYTDGGINTKLNTGWSYNPATDTWSEIPTLGAPEARVGHTALWTGEEMLIWGGRDQNDDNLNTGGRYNPLTKTWQPIDPAAFVDERTNHTAVWTGTEMIVWGGISNSHVDLSTGGRYNPKTNTWTATTQTGAPEGRSGHVAVWTGQEMLVWGGGYEDSGAGYGQVYLNNGAGYDPVKDAWTAMPTQAAPRARVLASAVWTGKEMLIWGGMAGMYMISSGGRYGYYADLEVSLSASPDPVKTGKEITYTIQLKNNGPAQAFDAMLEAPLPPHTSFVSAAATNGSGWAVEAPAPGGKGVVKFTKAAMANGESAQFQIVLKVERSAAEAKTLSLTVSASNDCVDLVSLDNSASVSTSVTLGEIPIFLPFLSKK